MNQELKQSTKFSWCEPTKSWRAPKGHEDKVKLGILFAILGGSIMILFIAIIKTMQIIHNYRG